MRSFIIATAGAVILSGAMPAHGLPPRDEIGPKRVVPAPQCPAVAAAYRKILQTNNCSVKRSAIAGLRALTRSGSARCRSVAQQNLRAAQSHIRSMCVGVKTTRIPGSVLAQKLQQAFTGTRIRLNNYGPRHGNSWYKGNDSHIRLSPRLGGQLRRFSIPAHNMSAGRRFYVNDVSLKSVQVDDVRGKIRIRFNFEDAGTEIKGRCASRIPAVCGGSDIGTPDFDLRGTTLVVHFPLTVFEGSLSYGPVQAELRTSVDGAGLGELIDGFVEGKLKQEARRQIAAALNTNSVRSKVAAGLRPTLDQQGIGEVRSVRYERSEFLITHAATMRARSMRYRYRRAR